MNQSSNIPDCHHSRQASPAARISASLAVFLLITGVLTFAFSQLHYSWNWESIWQYRHKFIAGWLTTVVISTVALTVSLLFGILTAVTRRCRFLPLRYLSVTYVEIIRGTPFLVQILIFFYVIADAFGVTNRYLAGILTLSVFSGAYLAEMIRSGINSISESQLDSARAIGLTRWQIYCHIITPQMLRQLIPPVTGQFASIIKDSSLLSVIAISEFTLNAQEVNAFTYSTLESYLPLALGYLLLTLPISLVSKVLEQKFSYAT